VELGIQADLTQQLIVGAQLHQLPFIQYEDFVGCQDSGETVGDHPLAFKEDFRHNRNMSYDRIGRYEIKAELGRGGMATVFHAYDPRFKRDVAVKVLPREFLHDLTFRERFEREAQTIATLEHQAIVPVYDFGEEEGQPYLVMRYMPGGSLADRLAHGALSTQEVTQILTRLAPALDKAHSQGIIHRDLKPANILFDDEGNPYLSDFGIAKLVEATAALTGSAIIGTPAYMSPEQAKGEEVDGRSDVYGLAVLLFEMLTGDLPYEADTPMGLAVKHITEPVPRILTVKPDLPFEIEAVMNKALAKEPDERFSTAGKMATSVTGVVQRQLERDKGEQKRLAREKEEQERKAQEKAEKERLAQEKAERKRIAREKAKQERLARQKAEEERKAREKAEKGRLAQKKAEQKHDAREKANRKRIATEKKKEEQKAWDGAKKERIKREREAQAPPKSEPETRRIPLWLRVLFGVILIGTLVGGFMLVKQGQVGTGPLAWLATETPKPTYTLTPTHTPTPTMTPTTVPTPTPTPIPTPIPVSWNRIASGKDITRDQITVITQDPKNQVVIYLGTVNSGIYKSINGGISWQSVNNGLERAYIISIAIDPEDTDTLYAGVSLGGVYKSTDGGASWQASNQGIDNFVGETSQIVIDPQDHEHLLYQAENGLYESFDKGANWSQLLPEGQCPYVGGGAFFSPEDSQTIFFVESWADDCEAGMYTSNDGGQTWMFIPTDINIKSDVKGVNLWQDSNGRLLLYVNYWKEISLLASDDNGATWYPLSAPGLECVSFSPILSEESTYLCLTDWDLRKSTNDGKTWRVIFERPSGGFIEYIGVLWNILVPPDDPDKIFVGGNGLFLSTNGGRTWSERSSGLGANRLEFVFRPGSGNLYLEDRGTGFLYESTDGWHTWILYADRGWDGAFDASGEVLYRIYGRDYRNFIITRKSGSKWWTEYILPADEDKGLNSISAHPSVSGLIYVHLSSRLPLYPPYI